eukprot:scaffold3148_cov275-Pinguiococcus_pyrenoidosus.AAC.1
MKVQDSHATRGRDLSDLSMTRAALAGDRTPTLGSEVPTSAAPALRGISDCGKFLGLLRGLLRGSAELATFAKSSYKLATIAM